MRIDEFYDLGLSEEELAELEQSLQFMDKAVQQEEDIPLPESLRGEALLHLLDGVEQDAPEEELQPKSVKPAGKLIFGVFPQKYVAAAAMLAMAVMVGVAYNRLPRTAEIGTSDTSSSGAVSQTTGDSAAAANTLQDSANGENGYASVLYEINDHYNRADKPVYDQGAVMQEEPPAEENQSKKNPQTSSNQDRTMPEETEQDDGEALRKEPETSDKSDKLMMQTAPEETEQDSVSPESAEEQPVADSLPAEEPKEQPENNLMTVQGDSSASQSNAAQGAGANSATAEEESAVESDAEVSANSTTQFRAAAATNRLSAETEEGLTYTLVPSKEDRCQAVLEVSTGEAAEPVEVVISTEDPMAYSRVLYDDGSLIVVGNLLEYPDEYLEMTRTVYEEVGTEGEKPEEDLRNSFVEMSQVTVYAVSEENPADLSVSRSYYQAGWCRDAAVTESGTLYTVTNKSIYGVNGLTEYLTEVIPVVGSSGELHYMDSSRIYVDDCSTVLDSYVVISGLNLKDPQAKLDTVAYLGDRMPVARIAEDGVYLGRTITGAEKQTSRMIRFDGKDLASVTESQDISGLLIPGSFLSLPDTGCAVLTGESAEYTRGGISASTVLVLDRSLGVVASAAVPVAPEEIRSVEIQDRVMLICTADKIYQVDFSQSSSPEVSVRV